MFPCLPGSAEALVRCCEGKARFSCLLSQQQVCQNYRNGFMYVDVVARRRCDVFGTQCELSINET